MKFGTQYEYQKIPEWYVHYMDYEVLKRFVAKFKNQIMAQAATSIDYGAGGSKLEG